jgi:threonyl-tRNA synthetase
MAVIGDREVESRVVAVRSRSGDDLGSLSIEELAEHLLTEIKERR